MYDCVCQAQFKQAGLPDTKKKKQEPTSGKFMYKLYLLNFHRPALKWPTNPFKQVNIVIQVLYIVVVHNKYVFIYNKAILHIIVQ